MEFMTPPSSPRSLQKGTSIGTPVATQNTKNGQHGGYDHLVSDSIIRTPTGFSSRELSNAKSAKSPRLDRFIANRNNVDFDYCGSALFIDENGDAEESSTPSTNKKAKAIESLAQTPKRILNLFQQSHQQSCEHLEFRCQGYDRSTPVSETPLKKTAVSRHIPSGPFRVLDAPDLMDDYYLNLLHWGKNNVMAVALQQSVYLWRADGGQIDQLLTLTDTDDYVTSVQWSEKDNILAVGTSSNVVQLWDASSLTKIRDMSGHSARVSSLAWNDNIISSGGRDSLILHHDAREFRRIPCSYVGHQQEVCGLAWSPDGKTLASGGNENMLCLWDAAMSGHQTSPRGALTPTAQYSPRAILNQHQAAVKAVAWCPWQRNVLASGGGTADRTLRVWNTALGSCIKSVDTGSQVCAIQWSDTYKELVSSHGFSDNQLILWKYSTMSKIREFRGHSSRVLHLAKSPDGRTICSGSADETLRFWDLFNSGSKRSAGSSGCKGRSTGAMDTLGVSPVLPSDSLSLSIR